MTAIDAIRQVKANLDHQYPLLEPDGSVKWTGVNGVYLRRDIEKVMTALAVAIPPLSVEVLSENLDDRIQDLGAIGDLRRSLQKEFKQLIVTLDAAILYDKLIAALDVNVLVKKTLKEISKEADSAGAQEKTYTFLTKSDAIGFHPYSAYPMRHVLKHGKLPFIPIYLNSGALISASLDVSALLGNASANAPPTLKEDIDTVISLENGVRGATGFPLSISLGMAIELVWRKRISAPDTPPEFLCVGARANKHVYCIDPAKGHAAVLGLVRNLNKMGKGAHKTGYHVSWVDIASRKVSKGVLLIPQRHRTFFSSEVDFIKRYTGRGFVPSSIYIPARGRRSDTLIQPMYKPLDLLCEQGGMPLRQKLVIAGDCAAALAAMHADGCVHCDVSMGNILLNDAGDAAMLIDFGLARKATDKPLSPRQQFLAGAGMRTPPEQHDALFMEKGAGPPGDVYELGCILYELFFWRRLPWHAYYNLYWQNYGGLFEEYNVGKITAEEVKNSIRQSRTRKAIHSFQLNIHRSQIGVSAQSIEGRARLLALAAIHPDPGQRLTAERIRERADELISLLGNATQGFP